MASRARSLGEVATLIHYIVYVTLSLAAFTISIVAIYVQHPMRELWTGLLYLVIGIWLKETKFTKKGGRPISQFSVNGSSRSSPALPEPETPSPSEPPEDIV